MFPFPTVLFLFDCFSSGFSSSLLVLLVSFFPLFIIIKRFNLLLLIAFGFALFLGFLFLSLYFLLICFFVSYLGFLSLLCFLSSFFLSSVYSRLLSFSIFPSFSSLFFPLFYYLFYFPFDFLSFFFTSDTFTSFCTWFFLYSLSLSGFWFFLLF